jgi:tripartite-type tricarboxylate transporter receptor subunit TctC
MTARLNRRQALVALPGLCSLPAFAQTYPERPIRWVVPYAAGGAIDIVTRIVGERMASRAGQPVVVENQPGAATVLATEAFVRARPDGYSILTAAGSALTLHPEIRSNLRYDVERDFAPISGLVRLPMVLVVGRNSPHKSLAELSAFLRKGNASYSSVGIGSPHHLVTESYLGLANAHATHVPFNGTVASLNDVVEGRIDFSVTDVAGSRPMIQKGLLRPLAVPSDRRSEATPDTPTFAEAGTPLTGFAWSAVVVPKDTPRPVIERINTEVVTALNEAAIAQRLREMGTEPLPESTPDQLRAFIRAERARWRQLIRERNLKLT